MTAYILLGDGFEEIEATAPGDILRRGGVEVLYVGIDSPVVTGARGFKVFADIPLEKAVPQPDDIIIIPGGLGGVESLEASAHVSFLLREAHSAGLTLAAICAGPRVLAKLGLLEGKTITCYPGMEQEMTGASRVTGARTETDGKLITGRSAGTAIDFGLALLTFLKGTGEATRVRENIYYD